MKQIATFLAFFWLLAAHALSLKADNPGPDHLTVSISTVTNAHVCGTSLVSVTFTSGPRSVEVNDFTVDLDNLNNTPDKITLKGLLYVLPPPGTPWISVSSGLGTSTPVFHFSGALPAFSSASLTMQVQYSCDFFDLPASALNGYLINASGTGQLVGGVPNSIPFNKSTPPYNIGFTQVTPAVNLPAVSATNGEPFSITVPLEISGTYCDNDFTVSIGQALPCLDYSQARYTIVRGGVDFGGVLIGGPFFQVKANEIGLPAFCETNYLGGMGEISLRLDGLQFPCGCGDPGTSYPLQIGITPCRNDEAPADCKDGVNVEPRFITTQDVYLENAEAGELALTVNAHSKFNLCDNLNQMKLLIANTKNKPAYNVDLDFLNQMGYQILHIKLNGTFYTPAVSGSNVHIDFSANTNPAYGLLDLNGDGIYEEMAADDPNQSAPNSFIEVEIGFKTGDPNHCSLGGTGLCDLTCQTTVAQNPLIRAAASWNNACNSLAPAPSAALSYSVGLPALTTNVIYDGSKIHYPLPAQRPVRIEIKGGGVTGLSGYFDQGSQNPLHRYLCINTNVDCIDYSTFTVNGVPVPGSVTNGFVDLGVVDPGEVGNTILEFQFTLNCCPLDIFEIQFGFQYGVFLEDCSDCHIALGCGKANFLSPCSGGAECDAFGSAAFNVYNDIFDPANGPVPVPVKVYPCDCIRIDVLADAVASSDNLIFGIKVRNNFVNRFNAAFTGSVTVTTGVTVSTLDFSDGTVQIHQVPGQPYTMIYFQPAVPVEMEDGSIIEGHFNICMASDFPSGFSKIEYFSPVMGAQTASEIEFCFNDFTDLYGLEPSYTIEETVRASCADGGLYEAKLIKHGGELYGPDFPGFPRVVASVLDEVSFDIDAQNQVYHAMPLDGACTEYENPYIFSPANMPQFPQPSGLEADGDVLQSFQVKFQENCSGNIPVRVEFEVNYRPGASDCHEEVPHAVVLHGDGASLPDISSGFGALSGTTVTTNTFTLNTFTANVGSDASEAWIELEYDPHDIYIDPALVTGDFDGSPGLVDYSDDRHALIIPIGGLANATPQGLTELMHSIVLNFFPASCAGSQIQVFGFHRCRCTPIGEFMLAADYTDPSMCPDSEETFGFEFIDAALDMEAELCDTPDGRCNNFSISANIDNYGQGDLEHTTFQLIIPQGLTLVDAFYETGSGDCTAGSVPVDIQELVGIGWEITDGVLPGVQSGADNEARRGHLVMNFSGCGMEEETADILVRCAGIEPCGTELLQEQEFHVSLPPFNLDLDVSLTGSITYNCQSDLGNVNIHIPAIANWPLNGVGTITLSSTDPNVLISISPACVNPLTFTGTPFTLNGSCITVRSSVCNFQIDAKVVICSQADCVPGTAPCEEVCQEEHFTLFSPASTGPTGTLVFSPNFCSLPGPGTGQKFVTATVSLSSGSLLPNFQYTQAIFTCDANGNGIADPGELPIHTAGFGMLTRVPNTNFYRTTIFVTPADLVDCNGGQVVVTFVDLINYPSGSCACVNSAVGSFCCGCGAKPGAEGGSGTISRDNGDLSSNGEGTITTAVFPNPSGGLYNLSVETAADGIAFVWIYNALGARIFQAEYAIAKDGDNRNSIDLSKAPAGIYYLNVSAGGTARQHTLFKN